MGKNSSKTTNDDNLSNSIKDMVEDCISRANSITKTDYFFKFENIYISFSLFENLFSKKIIANFYVKKEKKRKTVKEKSLNINEFNRFYNLLMESKNIFIGYQIQGYIKKKSSNEAYDDENELCPICNEKKVQIMLECSHFFCEKCIKTWLFDKMNTCPLCRLNIDLKKINLRENDCWDVVDSKEFENYETESAEQLKQLIRDYLS